MTSSNLELGSPVQNIPGVGPALDAKLEKLGVGSVGDLIYNFPRRYDDYSNISTVAKLKPGLVSLEVRFGNIGTRRVRRGLHVTEAVASDNTGSVRVVWFNQPYRAANIDKSQKYYISGQFDLKNGRLAITNPACEKVSSLPLSTARIVPIYRETKGLTSQQIRKLVAAVLPVVRQLPQTLPEPIASEHNLINHAAAVEAMHFPDSPAALAAAQKRLGFEEVFELSLAALLNKQDIAAEQTTPIPFKPLLAKQFVSQLPFKLTDDQRRTAMQIYKDMSSSRPMNRLVQGDVGSGKTVVALMAALMANHAGYQTAIMAPTELLAKQHADTATKLLEPLGQHGQLLLLTGSMSSAQKKRAHQAIKSGQAGIIIGTHALVSDSVAMHNLGLVVIDEQHRFGVGQRQKLLQKAGRLPHTLTLSATPIPRSLALTLYGELDISYIRQLPAHKKPINTSLVSPNSRSTLYQKIKTSLGEGRQMFVVCPRITVGGSLPDSQTVHGVYEQLAKRDFADCRVSFLHGKMSAEEKDSTMQQFVEGHVDILVASSVVEVGVDVPNATIMLVEGADRFGLAQLHQLRGRVGRGIHRGHCYLMLSDSQAPSPRLRALESTNDGFALAELDLSLRGPGAIYGTLQHGALDLRVAKLDDIKLIKAARSAAQNCLDLSLDVLKYKHIADRVAKLRSVTNLQ